MSNNKRIRKKVQIPEVFYKKTGVYAEDEPFSAESSKKTHP